MTTSAKDCAREIAQANAAITPQHIIDKIGTDRWAAALENDIAAYAAVIQRYLDQSIKDTRAEYEALARKWHSMDSGETHKSMGLLAILVCADELLALSPKPKV